MAGSCGRLEAVDCHVHHNREAGVMVDGMRGGARVSLRGCDIEANRGDGINVQRADATVSQVHFFFCIFLGVFV